MTNSWTGGQYSLFRAAFGAHLCVQLAILLRSGTEIFSDPGMRAESPLSPLLGYFPNPLFVWDSPTAVNAILALAILASVAFTIGRWDRIAAIVLVYVGACLFSRNPLISDPGPFLVAAILLGHAVLPTKPFGSWDARERSDPGGDWRMPDWIYSTAWIALGAAYVFVGVTKAMSPEWMHGAALAHALETPRASPNFVSETLAAAPPLLLSIATWAGLLGQLLFAPLALFARIRPWLWLVSLAMNLGAALFIDVSQQSAGLMLLHCFTFDPGWIGPRVDRGPTRVFYDGTCGLCHHTVRFLLAEDPDGERFRFAPIESQAFQAAIGEPGSGFEVDDEIPDSVLVARAGEPILVRAEGALALGQQLGGLWRIMATLGAVVPLQLLNVAYDFIARIRHRLFAKPASDCPLVPPSLQKRFLR